MNFRHTESYIVIAVAVEQTAAQRLEKNVIHILANNTVQNMFYNHTSRCNNSMLIIPCFVVFISHNVSESNDRHLIPRICE